MESISLVEEVFPLIQDISSRMEDLDLGAPLIIFAKREIARFLPHQNTLGFFKRSLARLGIPIKFSEGFSPKPRIHNTGAFPLGLESLCEVVSIELLQQIPLHGAAYTQMINDISKAFPTGMRILKITKTRACGHGRNESESISKVFDSRAPLLIHFEANPSENMPSNEKWEKGSEAY